VNAHVDRVVLSDDGDLEAAVERALAIVAAERVRPRRLAVVV
jgi:hypothetical protein